MISKHYFSFLGATLFLIFSFSAFTALHAQDNCPDIIVESAKVLKTTKKYAYIQYTIRNQGEGPANMHGKSKRATDNVAFKLFLSSDKKYNRGDINVGGALIDMEPIFSDGLLPVGETYTGEFKVNIKQKTSFTPHLILNLDGLQTLVECDETNNIGAVTL